MSDETPVERWRSPLGTWWVAAGRNVFVVATGHEQLERWLAGAASRQALPERMALTDGRRAAPALEAISKATLLADLRLVPRERLELAARIAGPLRGLARIAYVAGADGERVEIDLAPRDQR